MSLVVWSEYHTCCASSTTFSRLAHHWYLPGSGSATVPEISVFLSFDHSAESCHPEEEAVLFRQGRSCTAVAADAADPAGQAGSPETGTVAAGR